MPYIPVLPQFHTSDPGGTDMTAAFTQGRQVAGQNALADAVSNSTDDQGNVDPTAIQQNANDGGNPLAIIKAQEAAQQVIANQNAAQELHAKSIQYGTQAIGALPDNASLDDVNSAIDNYGQLMGQNGTPISPQFNASLKAQASKAASASPDGLKSYIDNMRAQHLAAQQQIDYRQGQAGQLNTGNTINPVVIGGMGSANPGGVSSAGGGIPLSMSPADANAPVTIPTANGQSIVTTKNRFVNGLPPANPLAAATGVVPQPVSPNGSTPNGGNMFSDNPGVAETINTALQPANQPAPSPAPANSPQATAAKFGGVVSGMPAGGETDAIASTGQGIALQQSADGAPARKAALNNMLGDLQNFTPGPSSSNVARLGALAQEFGVPTPVDKQGTAATEEFKKLASTISLAQSSAVGAGTDQGRNMVLDATPNANMSKLGITQIIGVLKGNEDAIAAKNQAWQAYKATNGPASYGQFSTQFNKNYDPRVFQMQYMDNSQKADLRKQVQNDPKFINALTVAHNNGWVTPNGQ